MDLEAIHLTAYELYMAAMVGVARLTKDLRTVHGLGADPKNTWTYNLVGACGEAAVAKALNIYWSGALMEFKARDVGEFQVRTSQRIDADLRLHKSDADDHKFILVIEERPGAYQLPGWAFGREAKQPQYWRDGARGRPAYWLPQSELRPMAELCT